MTPDRKFYEQVSDIVDRTRGSVPPQSGGGFRWADGGRIKRILRVGIISLCLLLPAAYIVDYVVLELRILAKRNPFGTVQIENLYAIHEKGGKTEYDYGGAENQTCVRSLFPHLGYNPCWYLNHRKEKRTDM
jgi:hypothetical protein